MNIAFVTLLIFILLLPGFVFMLAFHRGKFSRRYVRTSIFSDVARAIVPSLFFHSLAFFILQKFDCFKTTISFEAVGTLLMGGKSDETISSIFSNNIGGYIPNISCYLGCSILFGFGVGLLIVEIIRRNHLDLRFESIRFDNEWYYALSGEVLGWKKFIGLDEYKKLLCEDKISVFADILCCISGKSVIYSGFITEFFLDENGLDNLYFEHCFRRELDKIVDGEDVQPIRLMGGLFMLPSESIENVHLQYCEYIEIANKSYDEVILEITQINNAAAASEEE